VRAGLAARFAGDTNIRVLAPDEVAKLPDASFDFIVLHSVAQYLAAEETTKLLAQFHRLLKSDGLLLISDILPVEVPASTDAIALLRFGAAKGFFMSAVAGLGRTLLSDYWRLRSRFGLTRFSEAAMLQKLAEAGFAGQRVTKNIGHNQARMAFLARPR
jgi:SAM-dependent methyltransferase